jgi:hypothetical protein
MKRLLLLASLLPMCGFAQLQVMLFDGTTDKPIDRILEIGNAAPGDTLETRFHVRNAGPAALIFQTLAVAGASFKISSAPSLPSTIAPSNAAEFRVAFTPVGPGNYSASLQVNSTVITLRGISTAQAALLQNQTTLAANATVDFGKLERGQSATLSFTLSNPSASPVSVSTVSITGAGFRGPIGLTAPLTLAANASSAFQIAFEPQTAAPFNGTLSLDQRSFKLTGLGLEPALPKATLQIDSASGASGQQAHISIPLAVASKTTATGTLTMEFHPTATGATDDPAVGFLSGPKRIASVQIAAGDTVAHFAGQPNFAFQTGTTAGTIVFSLSLPNGSAQTTYTITPALVSLDSASADKRAGDLDVVLAGFDNTHAASALSFTFFDSAGKVLQGGPIRADAAKTFRTYFDSAQSGGMFSLRAVFQVSGDASPVAGVEVVITNPAGDTHSQRIPFN